MKHTADLDFALNRRQRARRRQVLLAALVLGFGMQLGLATWRVQTLESTRNTLQAQQHQLDSKSARGSRFLLTAEQTKNATSVQAMLDRLAVPWDELLQALETARPPRILMEMIQPHGLEGSVSIGVSSPDFATLAEFIQNLMQQDTLRDVTLVSETLSDSGTTLRAVITANWRKTQ